MSSTFCSQVNDLLVAESGRIGEMIPPKIIDQSPWIKLPEQAAFPEGIGQVISTLLYQRTIAPVVGDAAWTDVTFNNGTGNTCTPTPQLLQFAQTLQSYNLQQAQIRTPTLCVNDIRYGYQFSRQLAQMFDIMEQNTRFFWENRYRDEYLRLCGNQVIATPGLPSEAGAFPLIQPTARIDQGMLDTFRLALLRDGAGVDAYGMVNGCPQFVLILSPEASESLILQNSDIRQDFRFSAEVETLLAPLGVERSYKGFFHLIDYQAPRFNWVNGAFQRVPYYIGSPATYGTQDITNPAYATAQYECTFIWHPKVFTARVPAPITSPGGNTKFNPVNYRGDFQWINYPSDCNPLQNNGYFLGTFMEGSEAIRTEWGYALMHLRCNPATNYLLCS